MSTFFKSAEQYYAEMTSTMTDTDISKHSLIYNSLMPSCYELSYQSMMLDEALNIVYASTAYKNGYDNYLDLRIDEVGLTRKVDESATGTVMFTGTPTYIFPSGATVSTTTGITFTTDSATTIGSDGTAYANITATSTGTSYNVGANIITVMPVKYSGIATVTNINAIDNGVDRETNEELYNRYLTKIQSCATSGNSSDYKNWALSVEGCGSASVYPLWNGAGTVKVVIATSDKKAASSDLVTEVANYIESVRPIGATVSIVSVEEIPFNISFTLKYDSTKYTLDTIKSNIESSIITYMSSLDIGTSSININKIGALILDANGTIDYSNLTVNGGTSNISLSNTQVATLGQVTVNVS